MMKGFFYCTKLHGRHRTIGIICSKEQQKRKNLKEYCQLQVLFIYTKDKTKLFSHQMTAIRYQHRCSCQI